MKICLSFTVCFLLLAVYSLLIFGLLAFSMYLDYTAMPDWLEMLRLEVTVPAILNVIGYLIFQEVSEPLAGKLTDQENHQTSEEYETNYISKRFLFNFLGLCGPLFEILFINEYTFFQCS